ncbi:MAG: hypothetical protein B6245_04365 [Desulfobacteraceae bacterium 4572_88]|nr:MAG: hypothetical protein B6245_04365 [Desulfobacteraceae bacterium 4572_88]
MFLSFSLSSCPSLPGKKSPRNKKRPPEKSKKRKHFGKDASDIPSPNKDIQKGVQTSMMP